jgi:hypothetical protein
MSFFQRSKIPAVVSLVLFVISCGSGPKSAMTTSASDAPVVLNVVAQTNGVGTNRAVDVVFSKPMDPASINSSSYFVTGVPGTVTYDAVNKIASFKSTADYAPNTAYNATVTTAAKDTTGKSLAAPFNFSFTTRSTKDTSPPVLVAVNVVAGAKCVPLDQKIAVTFDEQMSSASINSTTVFIEGVAGSTTYDAVTQIATFTPTAALSANTTYIITVTTGVMDLGGVPLAAAYHQSFTTGPCTTGGGTQPLALCPSIGAFSVLAGTTVTNTGSSVISGDVGVSPGTAITGFPPGTAGTIHSNDSAAILAQTALTAAYIDAAGRTGGSSVAGDLAGQTFVSGVYASTSSLANTGDVTLDAKGDPSAIFIFQIASTLTTGSGSHVLLVNGATACNVYWQVGSSATLGTNSIFKGNILALSSITITTGVNFEGRALARNGAVTLDSDTIKGCACQ